MKRCWVWLAALIACVALFEAFPGWFARPNLLANQERAQQLAGSLDKDHSFEQTFVAGQAGLSAVEVFARVPPGSFRAVYTLRLTLVSNGRRVAQTLVPLARLQSQPRVRLRFPAQRDSAAQLYTLRVESDAPADTVSLLASQEDVYPAGDLSQEGLSLGRDLTFRTFTAVTPLSLARDLFSMWREIVLCLAVTLLVALVGCVGLILVGYLPDAAELLPWALGVGLCLIVVLFVALGMAWGWGLLLLALLAAARLIRRRSRLSFIFRPSLPAFFGLPLLFVGALFLRLAQVDGLAAPLWVDGYRHVEMIERILAAGRLPDGLLYHAGFHSLVALVQPLHAWCGLPGPAVPQTTLLVGQWAGAVGAISLYPLARRLLGGSRQAAFTATLALSLLAVFPSYLFNWGRYPYLMGLALLPLTLVAALELYQRIVAVDNKPRSPSHWATYAALGVLMLAGMILFHYGTLSFTFSFGVTWLWVERAKWRPKLNRRLVFRIGLGLGGLLGLGLLLGLLRFGTGIFETLGDLWLSTIAQSRLAGEDQNYAEILRLQLRGGGLWLALSGAVGCGLAALANRRLFMLTVGWFACHAVLIFVQAPLLGYALASYANLILAFALPGAILAGSLVRTASGFAYPKRLHFLRLLAPLGWMAAVLASSLSFVGLLNPGVVLLAPQDALAMAWLRENTPTGTIILANSNLWGSSETVASDGGAWVEAFTARQTVMLETPPVWADLGNFIRDNKIDYVYLGRFAGFLNQSSLAEAGLEPVYEQGGVTIYQVDPPP